MGEGGGKWGREEGGGKMKEGGGKMEERGRRDDGRWGRKEGGEKMEEGGGKMGEGGGKMEVGGRRREDGGGRRVWAALRLLLADAAAWLLASKKLINVSEFKPTSRARFAVWTDPCALHVYVPRGGASIIHFTFSGYETDYVYVQTCQRTRCCHRCEREASVVPFGVTHSHKNIKTLHLG